MRRHRRISRAIGRFHDRFTRTMERFHERFIRTNPRTAATGIIGFATLMIHVFPELRERLGPIADHNALETITLILVVAQGIFGGDAKDEIRAAEVKPDTTLVGEK